MGRVDRKAKNSSKRVLRKDHPQNRVGSGETSVAIHSTIVGRVTRHQKDNRWTKSYRLRNSIGSLSTKRSGAQAAQTVICSRSSPVLLESIRNTTCGCR